MSGKIIHKLYTIAGMCLLQAVAAPNMSLSMDVDVEHKSLTPQKTRSYDELIADSKTIRKVKNDALFCKQLYRLYRDNESWKESVKILRDYSSCIQHVMEGKSSISRLRRAMEEIIECTLISPEDLDTLDILKNKLDHEMKIMNMDIDEFLLINDHALISINRLITTTFDSSLHVIIGNFMNKNRDYLLSIIDLHVFMLWEYNKKLKSIEKESLNLFLSGIRSLQNEDLKKSEKDNLLTTINLYIGKVAYLIDLYSATRALKARSDCYDSIDGIKLAAESIFALNKIGTPISEITQESILRFSQERDKGISFSEACKMCKKSEYNWSTIVEITNKLLNLKILQKSLYRYKTPERSFLQMPNFLTETPPKKEKFIYFDRDDIYFGS